jgi:hypothetical protein
VVTPGTDLDLVTRRRLADRGQAVLIIDGSDDSFHAWPADAVDWTEATWFGAWVPERALSVYVYHWFRPVLGIYGGGCIAWDQSGHLPWEARNFQYDVNRPLPARLDLRKLELPTGTRITCLRDGWQYRIEFTNETVRLLLEFEATTAPDLTAQHGSAELFSGHLDQPGRYRGHIELDGERLAIECYGIRDRSWGPRVIGNDIRMGYCHGEGEATSFLAFSKPGSPAETTAALVTCDDTVMKGFLHRDGERIALAGGSRHVTLRDDRLERLVVRLADIKGRELEAEGTPLNYFTYTSYPNLLSRHYLVRWESADGTCYGEEQDLWSVPLWSAHARASRAKLEC